MKKQCNFFFALVLLVAGCCKREKSPSTRWNYAGVSIHQKMDNIEKLIAAGLPEGWYAVRKKNKILVSPCDSIAYAWFVRDLNPDYLYNVSIEDTCNSCNKVKPVITVEVLCGKHRWNNERLDSVKAYNARLQERVNAIRGSNEIDAAMRASRRRQQLHRLMLKLPDVQNEKYTVFVRSNLDGYLRYFYLPKNNPYKRDFQNDFQAAIKTCRNVAGFVLK